MAVSMTRDARGGEQRTETGVGRITGVELKGERNAHVTINASHLREEVKGWVDRQGPVWPRVQAAHADGRDVWYQVDVHRKGSVDVSIPIAQVERRDKVRDLVRIERPEDAPSAVPAGPQAASDPSRAHQGPSLDPRATEGRTAPPRDLSHAERDEVDAVRGEAHQRIVDAATQGAQPAEMLVLLRRSVEALGWSGLERALHAAGYDYELRHPDEHHMSPWLAPIGAQVTRERPASTVPTDDAAARAAQAALAQRRDPDRVGERAPATRPMPDADGGQGAGRPVSSTSGLSRQRVSVASDGKPWDVVNSDGRTNLGSYAAGAVVELTNLAGRLLITRARHRHEDALNAGQTSTLHPPTEKALTQLARTLVRMADQIQVSARGGRVDRMGASHKVARQALREGLDLYPVPWGAEAPEVEEWERAVVAHGTMLVTVAVAVLEASGDDFRTD